MPDKMPRPRCLLVPGLNNSGPRHWQSRWEVIRDDCFRVDLGAWSNPHRSHWVTKLDLQIAQEQAPVILVAHSLGCLAIAWWTALASPDRLTRVAGAMLVAPPDVENPEAHEILRRFAPAPLVQFPFPAVLVASRDDNYASFDRSGLFARRWGVDLHDAGQAGHINADSFLGDWSEGQLILDKLIGSSAASAMQNQGPYVSAPNDRAGLRGH